MGFIFSSFLIPLLSGFLILSSNKHTKRAFISQNGISLIFSCLICGLISYYIISFTLTFDSVKTIKDNTPVLEWIDETIDEISLNTDITTISTKSRYIDGKLIKEETITQSITPKSSLALKLLLISSFIFYLLSFIYNTTSWIWLEIIKQYPNNFIIRAICLVGNYLSKEYFTSAKIHSHLEKDINSFSTKGPIEKTISKAIQEEKKIIVSLKSRKVYVGYIKDIPLPKSQKNKSSITILLTASGYRDSDNLNVTLDNDYLNYFRTITFYRKLKPKVKKALDNKYNMELESSDENDKFLSVKQVKFLLNNLGVSIPLEEIEIAAIWTGDIIENRIEN